MIHLEYAQNKRCYTANWTPLQKTWKPIVTSLRFDLFERILLSCPSYLKEDTRVIPVVKKKIKPVMQKSNPRMEKKTAIKQMQSRHGLWRPCSGLQQPESVKKGHPKKHFLPVLHCYYTTATPTTATSGATTTTIGNGILPGKGPLRPFSTLEERSKRASLRLYTALRLHRAP